MVLQSSEGEAVVDEEPRDGEVIQASADSIEPLPSSALVPARAYSYQSRTPVAYYGATLPECYCAAVEYLSGKLSTVAPDWDRDFLRGFLAPLYAMVANAKKDARTAWAAHKTIAELSGLAELGVRRGAADQPTAEQSRPVNITLGQLIIQAREQLKLVRGA